MEQAHLLIADQAPRTRLELKGRLTGMGHVVVGEAASGEQTLALARSLRPDAVILDLAMPRPSSGVTVAGAILTERVAPVIAVAGESEREMVLRAVEAGVLAVLSRPVRPEDVGWAVAVAIGRFRQITALEEEIRSLGERMEARKLVGRAKAILMERHGLTEREAFRRIQEKSQGLGRPPHEIAQAIITASEIPTGM